MLLALTTALAALMVILFLGVIVGSPLGVWHTRLALGLQTLFARFADERGDVPAGDGGGDGGDEGDEGDDNGSSDSGDGGQSLEADARAAIDALKQAGADIPAALTKAVDELAQARKDAGRYRTERNGSATEVKALQDQMTAIAKKLGIEDAKDPSAVAEAAQARADQLEAENRQLKVSQALTTAARSKGADADALSDSRSFMATVEKLDPSDDKFTEALEAAVEKAVKDNPKLKAQAARSGNDLNGGGGGGTNGDRPKSLVDAVTARYAG